MLPLGRLSKLVSILLIYSRCFAKLFRLGKYAFAPTKHRQMVTVLSRWMGGGGGVMLSQSRSGGNGEYYLTLYKVAPSFPVASCIGTAQGTGTGTVWNSQLLQSRNPRVRYQSSHALS